MTRHIKIAIATPTGSKVQAAPFHKSFNKGSRVASHISLGGVKMARQWQQISLEEAKRHPLYGIKNWLAVFGIGILISPLRTVGELSNSAHEAGLTLSQALNSNTQISTFVKADLAFNLTIAAVLLWLLFSKHRHFRLGSIALLVLQWPAYFVVVLATGGTQIPGLGAALTTQFLSSLLLIAIWVTYLQRSRRVRVTFENCVVVERNGQNSHQNSQMPQASKPMVSSQRGGNDSYAAALAEIEEGRLDKGAWARSFAESGGDESKAKALYIKARAEATKTASIWMDTQPTTENCNRAEAVQVSRRPADYEGLPKWVPVFIVFMIIAGIVMYQELSNRQTAAATPVQTPAATKDQFGGTLIQEPVQMPVPQVDYSKFEPVKVESTDHTYGRPERPLTRSEYVEKVHSIIASVDSGVYSEVIGSASFEPPLNRFRFPDSDPKILESNQTSWHNEQGELRIHIQNTATADLTVLGLTFEDQRCGSNIGARTFYVFLSNPVVRSTQAVIRFKPNFPLKKGNYCLVISSLWS